ncbi:hypothetical protein ElyMa_001841700 [Elysia marginata]|uniref:Uncharacterized protein n=1 Tax=Elysia marginata TaxID=1093978 RepID=A0AAV4EJH4_9GAST|nr:hypothetical protein ElyMa_001841700 [Elysia marginata]
MARKTVGNKKKVSEKLKNYIDRVQWCECIERWRLEIDEGTRRTQFRPGVDRHRTDASAWNFLLLTGCLPSPVWSVLAAWCPSRASQRLHTHGRTYNTTARLALATRYWTLELEPT